MKLCPNKSACGKENQYSDRYCKYCGILLETVPSWSMAGGDVHRLSRYSGFKTNVFYNTAFRHDYYPSGVKYSNLPQVIMVFDTVWGVSPAQKEMFRVPLNIGNVKKRISPVFSSEYLGESLPEYCTSPAFDGVCVDFIFGDEFIRVSALDGKIVGKKLRNPLFKNTQRSTPLVVEYNNPEDRYRPFRYWITVLKGYLLIVDIRFVHEETYHLIELPVATDDELRSPAVNGDRVYIVSRKGKMFSLHINGDFQSVIVSQAKACEEKGPEGVYCCAPMAVNGHILFETLSIASSSDDEVKKNSWHEVGFYSFNTQTGDARYFSSGEFARLSNLENFGHVSGLSDGRYAFYPSKYRRKFDYVKIIPGQPPKPVKLKKGSGQSKLPAFTALNAIIYKQTLLIVDQNLRRLVRWNLNRPEEPEIDPIPVTDGLDDSALQLVSQPVAFGDVLVLVFSDQIVVLDIKF